MTVTYLQRAAAHFEPPTRHHAADLMLAAGLSPDPWQAALMRERPDRALLLCSRQAGKSMTVAAVALEQALNDADSTTLLVSPTQRQSAELLAKVRTLAMARKTGVELDQSSVLSMRLTNGSRIVSLPGRAEVIRGYSADLLVLDEAAWIPDLLYESVRPMLAVSGGRLIALSTPFGRRGWFHSAWSGTEDWHRTKVTAYDVPRITAEFLEEERRSLPSNVFAAEYLCQFSDTLESVFASEDLCNAISDEVAPLFGAWTGAEGAVVPLFAGQAAS
jgi:Terminase large subunit, T4likevirus-type, N-terminal